MQTLLNSLKSYCGFREAEPEADMRYPEWRNHGEGNWEFSGETIDDILNDIPAGVISVRAPNAKKVSVNVSNTLKKIIAPKAEVLSVGSDLNEVNVPKAKIVTLSPEVNEDTVCKIISQLANIQDLESFKIAEYDYSQAPGFGVAVSKEIAQDIKYHKKQNNEAQFYTLIGATQHGNRLVTTLLGTMDNRHPEKGAEIFGKIMDYAGLKHENLAALNKAALLGYRTNQQIADESIKDYKKQNQRSHEEQLQQQQRVSQEIRGYFSRML